MSMACGMVPLSSSPQTPVPYTNPTHILLMNGTLPLESPGPEGRRRFLSISGHILLTLIRPSFRRRRAQQVTTEAEGRPTLTTSQYRGRRSGCTEGEEGAISLNHIVGPYLI